MHDEERFPKGVSCSYVLVLASLACSVLGSGALLEDDFSGSDSSWGTGTDADSSVEYLNDGLNMFVAKDFWFVWSTPNDEQYENIHIEVTARTTPPTRQPPSASSATCRSRIPPITLPSPARANTASAGTR
jgi:hypothetical protein